MNIEVVPATLAHALRLAPRMRASDVREIYATDRSTPLTALMDGIDISTLAFTVLRDGEPDVIFGVVVLSREWGVIWALGTDEIRLWPKTFVRLTRKYVHSFHDLCTNLYNFVDTRNVDSIRWLHRCGFQYGTLDLHHGADGRPFIQMTSTRQSTCA